MKITDKDRELAAELVEILTDGVGNALTIKCVAIALAAHRYSEQGRCGLLAPSGPGFPVTHCALPAGHGGWHRGDRNDVGKAPEWSP